MKKRILSILLSFILCLGATFTMVGCAPKTFTVTFSGNGGTLVSGVEIQTVTSADQLEPPVYQKAGYTFAGWDEILESIKKNTIVEALWEKQPFTVTFDGDGGTLVSGETVQTVLKAEDLRPPRFAKEGYEQDGWDTDLSKIVLDATVKAVYLKNKFTVKFEGNGGVKKEGDNIQYVREATEIVAPVYVKTGYDLTWDKDLTTITENTTVRAIWTAKKYNVTLDTNGGQLPDNVDSVVQVTFNSSNYQFPTPEKDGYSFTGWYYNGKIVSGEKWTYNTDLTLIAGWTEDFAITYSLGGGTFGTEIPPQEYNANTGSFTIPNPTRSGYKFLGWTGTGIEEPTKDLEITSDSLGNRQYVANWQAKTYTLKLDKNDGTTGGSINTITVTYGEKLGELETPTRSGYRFKGWYYSSVGNSTFDVLWNKDDVWAVDYTPTTPNDMLVAKAMWERAYTIKFVLNAPGSQVTVNGSSTVEDRIVYQDNLIGGLPEAKPVGTNYKFIGWYDGSGRKITSDTVVNASEFPTATNGIITLTAKCEYTLEKVAIRLELSYTRKDGTVIRGTIDGKTEIEDHILNIGDRLPNIPTPTPENVNEYYFSGWVYKYDNRIKMVESGMVVNLTNFPGLEDENSGVIVLIAKYNAIWTGFY